MELEYFTIEKLGSILKDKYDNAPEKEQVANIHLFGIKYAEVIKSHSYTAAQIIREAGIKKSFSTELSKGIRLSKFVIIKKEFDP